MLTAKSDINVITNGRRNIDVAEEFAAVAAAPSLIETAEVRREIPVHAGSTTFVDRAESGVQLLSRWAGILTFVGALSAIAWLIF
ncbi:MULTISPECIES: hypothetical protein [unclassified Sphingobium]|uniref:hypothetical protein n=1 Tax=unclassified Sphingobium TaxID=2611147 RepID=UPI00341ECEC6